MTRQRYPPGNPYQGLKMGAMIWDFPIRWSRQPSKEECEAAEQVEREERDRLIDAEQDDAPKRVSW